mgnify:CR=1 FL=1
MECDLCHIGDWNDFQSMLFYELFHYDFSEVEKSLKVDCFRIITDYRAIEKREEGQ